MLTAALGVSAVGRGNPSLQSGPGAASQLGYNGLMQYRLHRARMPDNPLLQFVALVVAAIMAVGAVFLGAILLSLFLGLALIVGVVLYVRLWWLRRKMSRRSEGQRTRSGDFVEVEYTVVEERSPSDEPSRSAED